MLKDKLKRFPMWGYSKEDIKEFIKEIRKRIECIKDIEDRKFLNSEINNLSGI